MIRERRPSIGVSISTRALAIADFLVRNKKFKNLSRFIDNLILEYGKSNNIEKEIEKELEILRARNT